MATTIKVKRRTTVSGNANVPLNSGELYWNEVDSQLYIGGTTGTSYGQTWIQVGGSGAFVKLDTAQTIGGVKTFSSVAQMKNSHDTNSSDVATVDYVANSIGNAIADDFATNAKLADMNANTIKGRVSTAGDPQDLSNTQVKTLLNIQTNDIASFTSTVNGLITTKKLSELASPDVALDLNSQRITNLAPPTGSNDAARKIDVENAQNGLEFKEPVRVVATSPVTLEGVRTIDSIQTAHGDRVLLTAQGTASQNGIWVARGAGIPWTRPADWNSTIDQSGSAFVFVQEGTANSDSAWVCTTNGTITVDTTATAWTPFSSNSFPGGTPVQLTYGGTGRNATAIASGDILYGPADPSTASSWDVLGIGVAGSVLTVGAGNVPEWSDTIDGGTFS